MSSRGSPETLHGRAGMMFRRAVYPEFCGLLGREKPGTRMLLARRWGAHSRARFCERLCTAAWTPSR